MSEENSTFPDQKTEKLYIVYQSAFENFKKNKKDGRLQTIKDMSAALKTPSQNFSNRSQIWKYSMTLVEPFEKCTTKTMETILNSMEEILKKDLLDYSILQKMVEKLIVYIPEYFQINEIDFEVDDKILKICELIYSNPNIFIHNENLKNIIKIFLRIYLSISQIEQFQEQTHEILKVLINRMIELMTVCNITNKNSINSPEQMNIELINDLEVKKKICYKIQLNEFNYISKKYLDYLIDLIEIQSQLKTEDSKDINLITDYISIIQNNNLEEVSSETKSELEKLNLPSLDIEYFNEEQNKSFKIGKYGWCILCRKTADHWSDKLNFPVCGNSFCETEFQKCLSNIYPRSDFLNMLVYLSNTSIIGSEDEYSSTNSSGEMNFLCRKFCLENIKEMIEKSYNFFKNDNDVIFIIKEIFKDSLLKNTLSSNIKVFQQSLELFISIIKGYREHLKEQIEIFFMKVLITFLESENLEFVFKDYVLDALLTLVNDCSILVELYVNFDCDVNCPAVFSELINLLTKIMNGLYRKSKYQNNLKPIHENLLMNKTLNFLFKFIVNLNELVEKNDKKLLKGGTDGEKIGKNIPPINNNENNNEDNVLNSNNQLNNNEQEELSGSSNNIIDLKDKINKNLRLKKLLEKAIEVFNIGKSSSECLKYLKEKKMIFIESAFDKIKNTYITDINNNTIKNDYSKLISPEEQTIITESSEESSTIDSNSKINIMQTPFISTINPLVYYIIKEDKQKLPDITYEDYVSFEMARFIKTNLKDLIRDRVGDYLCSGKPFNIKVLTHFINNFDFEKNNILDAMRILFAELPLSGEAQVIDRVVQVFGEKFHRQNPNELQNPDHCYYLAFSILQLNTDLHRSEVEKKMSLKEFIDALNLSTGQEKIDPKYLENLYNKVLTDPLVIPGQKLSGMSKNKKEILHQERENIKLTINKLSTIKTKSYSSTYVTEIDNDNIKHLIDFSWSNFFSIYSQLLAENDNEKTVNSCIEIILLLAKTCGLLKLNTAEEACVNSIISITNLNDNREINQKNLESIKSLINFINNSGQYIRTGWLNILQIISKLDYFLMTESDIIVNDIKNNKKGKNVEKEITLTLQKKDIICKNISDMACEGIFSKTDTFDEETIINFVINLCTVSKEELTDYYTPRVFSLHKLVEVADFNIFRIQVQWVKIWKLINDHLVDVISNSAHENIWREALESLRQTICKLLQKKDLSIYNFQMDFFTPFEIIFNQTAHTEARGEMIINYIYYIVGSFANCIHSGWIVIFRILKEGFQRRHPKMNEDIKKILQKIYEDNSIFNNVNPIVFRGYIECLCYMYLDKTCKQYAFETILNLLSKIMSHADNQQTKQKEIMKYKQSVMQLPNINKKFDYLKIFFYGFDDIISINVIEHLNLLFEIISHNKNIIFTKDCNSFLYMYYLYFKPHLVILLLSRYINRFNLFDKENNELLNNKENKDYNYSQYKDDNTFEAKTENIKNNLIDSLGELIDDFNSEESEEYNKMFEKSENQLEHKRALVGFLREIKEGYAKEEMTATIFKKLKELSNLDEHNYELAIEFFLEKLKEMCSEIEGNTILKYNYFYEDLFLTIHKLLIINNNSDLLIKILNKILSKGDVSSKFKNKNKKTGYISQECISKINDGNLFLLNLISKSKSILTEEELHRLIKFSSSYSSFLLNFIQHFDTDIITEYKLISSIFSRVLEIDLDNTFKQYKIVNSSSTIDFIIKLQGIQSNILSKLKDDEYEKLYEKETSIKLLVHLNQIFSKYKLGNEDNSMMFNVIQFELENTLPKFILFLDRVELKILFNALLDFTDSLNSNLRKIAGNLLLDYSRLNLVSFRQYEEQNK